MSAAKNLMPPWQPGQSGNPSGRPRIPEAYRAVQSLSQIEACKRISRYARMSPEQIEVAKSLPTTDLLDRCIISIFEKCMQYGDNTRLQFLLDRAIGKAPQLNETDEEKAARQALRDLSDQELVKLVKENLPELEGPKE